MSTTPSRYHLFQAFGIELEYMIVDRETLQVRAIVDELLKSRLGEYGGDFENGVVTWSNELVNHVVELKSTKPEQNLNAIGHAFADNVRQINELLLPLNCMLMPTASHPFMDPARDTRLWPHDNGEIYALYNTIFDCRGHGWSNVQSTHLNLPFYDDEEFARLHAAIRIVLPILPALCASSPILDGRPTGNADSRLTYYKTNQSRLPSITGRVIPEALYSRRQYGLQVYDKISAELAPFDTEKILDPVWVNSRGAIPRFDRGSIEIRLMDIQECPAADMAIIQLVIETIRAMVSEELASQELQMAAKTEILSGILDDAMVEGPRTEILSSEYLAFFGLRDFTTAGVIWSTILNTLLKSGHRTLEQLRPELDVILEEGPLADRIMKAAGKGTPAEISAVYRRLCGCLDQNKMFIP